MGENRNTDRILVGKPEGHIYLADQGVDGGIILNWILNKMGRHELDSTNCGEYLE
jgi:hypothetical protein